MVKDNQWVAWVAIIALILAVIAVAVVLKGSVTGNATLGKMVNAGDCSIKSICKTNSISIKSEKLFSDFEGVISTTSSFHSDRIFSAQYIRAGIDSDDNLDAALVAGSGGIIDNRMKGSGSAFVCVNSVGQLFRSLTACR